MDLLPLKCLGYFLVPMSQAQVVYAVFCATWDDDKAFDLLEAFLVPHNQLLLLYLAKVDVVIS